MRDELLRNLGDEVREREHLALIDKNFLTIADAALLLLDAAEHLVQDYQGI